MLKLDRRNLIKAGGSIPLIAGFARSPLLAAPLGANPFTLGVASGDPWPDGFVPFWLDRCPAMPWENLPAPRSKSTPIRQ